MDLPLPGFEYDAEGKPIVGIDPESAYAFGSAIRATELLLLDLFSKGLLSGTTHTCIGQEICQMSVVRALRGGDIVLSNHRNHGHFLTYSGDFVGLVAEVMGRRAGVCGGYGGSQHLALRGFHSNGVQGGMTAIGAGIALSLRRRGGRDMVAAFIGDGTLGEGLVYESMNLAASWRVPVLFVVENNRIAQTTETARTVPGEISARGAAFGLETWSLDDSHEHFLEDVQRVVDNVRHTGAPGLLVVETRRLGPHSKGDDLRDAETMAEVAQRDPLARLGEQIDPARRAIIDARTEAFVSQVAARAIASPEATFDEVPRLSLRPPEPSVATGPVDAATTVRTAINRALSSLLEDDPRVLVIGEDLHEPYGGAFKVTAGLSSRFPDRVLSTPISEAAIVGAGIGMAMQGERPIVEIMFADFVTLCMDQLYNHAVKFPGMFPDVSVPLVVRAPCGGRRGYGPTHSQSPENLLVSVPGLTVLYPSHRHDCAGLLSDAVRRWPNPLVFLEHKLLYGERVEAGGFDPVVADPRDAGASLFPTLRRGGGAAPDLTIVTFGGMLPHVETAAIRLEAEEELVVEIVVPSLIAPLPRHTLLEALRERARILVVEESHHEFGVAAEILASLAEVGHRGRLARIGAPPVPIAAARSLERELLPDESDIVEAAVRLMS